MLITAPALEALRITLNRDFFTGMNARQPAGLELFKEMPSTSKLNTYAWLGAFPKWREWVGPRHFGGITERSYSIVNKTYEGSIRVSRESIEDNDIIEPRMIAQQLGERASTLKEDLLVQLLQNGHTRTGYDGQNFFDTDHPIDLDSDAGTQANLFPGTALTADNLWTVYAAMATQRGEDGEPLGITPDTLYVPPQLYMAALGIVSSPLLAGGATNPMNGLVRVVMLPKLGNQPATWYLASTGGAMRPFIFQNRRDVAVTAKFSPTDDTVFYRDMFEFGGDARFGAGYGLHQLISRAAA